jgi:hypothetical protein
VFLSASKSHHWLWIVSSSLAILIFCLVAVSGSYLCYSRILSLLSGPFFPIVRTNEECVHSGILYLITPDLPDTQQLDDQ